MEDRQFPIMLGWENRNNKTLRRSIPWAAIVPHEPQAIKNHSQSLERLAQRGGLSPQEAIAVISGLGYGDLPQIDDAEAVAKLTQIVGDHLQGWCVIWEVGKVPQMTSNIATEALANEYANNLRTLDPEKRVVAVCLAEKLRQLTR